MDKIQITDFIKKMQLKIRTYILSLTQKKLNPSDTMLLQNHGEGNYYIRDREMQDLYPGAFYKSVRKVAENQNENGDTSYLYIGFVGGAGNATGLLETDKELDEIIQDSKGNEVLIKILSDEFALDKCHQFWRENEVEFDENTTNGNSLKPSFFLGSLKSKENYKLEEEITPMAKDTLKEMEDNEKKHESRVNPNNVRIDLGPSLKIPEEICYINKTAFKKEYCGVNLECLDYKYSNPRKIGNNTGMPYIYAGSLLIGGNDGKTFSFSNYKNYPEVVIELDKSLDQLFVTENYLGIAKEFLQLFSEGNIIEKQKNSENGFIYAGKITQTNDGLYKVDTKSEPSEITIKAMEKEKNTIKPKDSKIIPFNGNNK